MSKIDVDHMKILSDPNRLTIISLLSTKEMTTTQLSQELEISVQNAQYHIRKLADAGLISHTRSGVVGNLVEKYYRSAFEPGMISDLEDDARIDISEREDLVFAALGAIKGILDRGIRVLDEKKDGDHLEPEEFSRYPFSANYIIIPNTPETQKRAEALVSKLEEELEALASESSENDHDRYAFLYALFPYD